MSRTADVPLGMMDGAYFTGRKEILEFFNATLNMNLSKIEETATGAIACQLMDYLFPGSIPMKRVNWTAKSDYEFIENYKLLQMAFSKQRVQKRVDVDRLIRAKYQDNLEFCQWLKAFSEHASSDVRDDYDALGRRMLGKGGKNLPERFLPKSGNASASVSRPRSARPMSSSSAARRGVPSSGASVSSVSSRATTTSRRSTMVKSNPPLRDISLSSRQSAKSQLGSATTKQVEKLEAQNTELTTKNATMRRKLAETELILENIEKERDFYFDKLRGIEVMLQVHEENGEVSSPDDLIQKVFKVLYAKVEDKITVTDDGELLEEICEGQEDLLNDSAISMLSVDDENVAVM